MPTFLCHGFRWSRRNIRVFVVVQDIEDAAPEWIMGRASSRAILKSFHEVFEFLPPCTSPLATARLHTERRRAAHNHKTYYSLYNEAADRGRGIGCNPTSDPELPGDRTPLRNQRIFKSTFMPRTARDSDDETAFYGKEETEDSENNRLSNVEWGISERRPQHHRSFTTAPRSQLESHDVSSVGEGAWC